MGSKIENPRLSRRACFREEVGAALFKTSSIRCRSPSRIPSRQRWCRAGGWSGFRSDDIQCDRRDILQSSQRQHNSSKSFSSCSARPSFWKCERYALRAFPEHDTLYANDIRSIGAKVGYRCLPGHVCQQCTTSSSIYHSRSCQGERQEGLF